MKLTRTLCAAMLMSLMTAAGCGGKDSGNGSVDVDQSSPKAAARTLFEAMAAGDEDAAFAVLIVEDRYRPMVSATMANMRAQNELEDAFVDKFGQEAWDSSSRRFASSPPDDAMEQIEQAEVNIDGDTATMTVRGDTVTLRRVDGDWKIAFADMMGAPESDEDIQEAVQMMQQMAGVFGQLTEGVASGEVTAENIGQKYNEAMMRAMNPDAANMPNMPEMP